MPLAAAAAAAAAAPTPWSVSSSFALLSNNRTRSTLLALHARYRGGTVLNPPTCGVISDPGKKRGVEAPWKTRSLIDYFFCLPFLFRWGACFVIPVHSQKSNLERVNVLCKHHRIINIPVFLLGEVTPHVTQPLFVRVCSTLEQQIDKRRGPMGKCLEKRYSVL
mmetsp:Transcript_19057/g.38506  ORF Transcript_19057/g.38506 Transcript_19057/m.38506 type:complete len:164 (-) Transcript_19057:81-572(-)